MSPQMRIKGPILLMICILVTSIFYCLIGDPKPSLQNIVSETHRQLSQPLKRLKDAVVPAVADSSNYYLGNDREPDSQLSDKYLRALGFVDSPRLFPSDVWHNVTLPVFVSAIKSGEANLAAGFVKSLQDHLPEYNLVLYDLGLDQDEITLVSFREEQLIGFLFLLSHLMSFVICHFADKQGLQYFNNVRDKKVRFRRFSFPCVRSQTIFIPADYFTTSSRPSGCCCMAGPTTVCNCWRGK